MALPLDRLVYRDVAESVEAGVSIEAVENRSESVDTVEEFADEKEVIVDCWHGGEANVSDNGMSLGNKLDKGWLAIWSLISIEGVPVVYISIPTGMSFF